MYKSHFWKTENWISYSTHFTTCNTSTTSYISSTSTQTPFLLVSY